MVLLVHFSFIHQTVIESASTAVNTKDKDFYSSGAYIECLFFPLQTLFSDFLVLREKSKLLCMVAQHSVVQASSEDWGLVLHATIQPHQAGWFPYIPLQGDSSSPWRRAPRNPILLLSVTPTHTLRFKNHV